MSSKPIEAPLVRISAGSARDLDPLIQIMDAAFDDRFGEAWTRSQCAGILPLPGVSLEIASLDGGEPVGFSLFRVIADDAELLLLAVSPGFRRRGIGRALLDSFIGRAADGAATRIHLEVRDGNPAVEMYRAAGFSQVGCRRKYYRGRFGGEFDALTLSKTL